jgi:hypothetical protein
VQKRYLLIFESDSTWLDGSPEIVGEPQNTMWVNIGSWDTNGWEHPETSHTDIKKLLGKQVRVTIEVIDE